MLWALLAAPAVAHGGADAAPLRSDCHAVASFAEDLTAVVADRNRWRCGSGEPTLGADRAMLRFTVGPGENPRFFATRPSPFEGLTLIVQHGGRIVAAQSMRATDIPAGPHGERFLAELPARAGPGDQVVVVFDRPSTRGLFSEARLHPVDPVENHETVLPLLIAALVCGMLFMPLAFNAAYYRVLRERFVLWHMAVSAGLLVQCLLTSGLVGNFVSLPVPVHARLVILSFAISVAAAAAFCASFIEPRKLHPRLRIGLYIAAAQVLIVSLVHAFLPNFLRSVQTPLYYASFIPVLALFVAAMADASKRGSRAVRYQVVGWLPFMAVGIIRIVTMLSTSFAQNEAMNLFYVAMVIESIATSLGVADRFTVIKRQRDRAVTRAASLEHLSERDDLTGLYNRRALDGRLGDFVAQGFTGFALFDLDNFKRVNDTHGHAVGDTVLRTVARVLSSHHDAVALRMGGEEFLLLLRGDEVSQRVERLREAIPVRIAREVAELELLVTSSAGLVEWSPGSGPTRDFETLYRTADDLLYEAKHNGRNLLAAVVLEQVIETNALAASAA
jgi:diguanylate cyclase (GGDEF)-like protein